MRLRYFNARLFGKRGFTRREPFRCALRSYWTIPDRQIESSVVLAHPPLDAGEMHS